MFKLKTGVEEFSVVEGPFAGKRFKRGVAYEEVPENEKKKFEEIKNEPVTIKKAAKNSAAAETSK